VTLDTTSCVNCGEVGIFVLSNSNRKYCKSLFVDQGLDRGEVLQDWDFEPAWEELHLEMLSRHRPPFGRVYHWQSAHFVDARELHELFPEYNKSAFPLFGRRSNINSLEDLYRKLAMLRLPFYNWHDDAEDDQL
jgi:hypothetical protein